MKKILVPTDFSEPANNALEAAKKLVKEKDGELFVLHLESKKDRFESAEIKMSDLIDEIKAEKINVTPILLNKKPEGSIVKQAEKIKADLIVMGSQGTKLSDKLVGSNTERVIRLSSTPVLIVKNKLDTFKVKNIVFASSFYREIEPAFPKIQEFAETNDAVIHLLKVITPKNFETTAYTERLIEDFVNSTKLKNYTVNIYNHESTEDGILEFCGKIDADLIAMTTHGRKGLSKFIVGSLAESVSDASQVPVLCVKLPDRKANDSILFPE